MMVTYIMSQRPYTQQFIFLLGYINYESMRQARNQLSHIYDDEISRNLFDSIINNYIPAFQEFEKRMSGIL